MSKSKIILSSLIFCLIFSGLVFAADNSRPLRVADSLSGAKDVFLNILKPFFDNLNKIWKETLEICQKAWNWIKNTGQDIWQRIQAFFNGEFERRKEIIKEELPKEKEELKEDLPETLKSLWEKFKGLIR